MVNIPRCVGEMIFAQCSDSTPIAANKQGALPTVKFPDASVPNFRGLYGYVLSFMVAAIS
jgi:hypothetical protein